MCHIFTEARDLREVRQNKYLSWENSKVVQSRSGKKQGRYKKVQNKKKRFKMGKKFEIKKGENVMDNNVALEIAAKGQI